MTWVHLADLTKLSPKKMKQFKNNDIVIDVQSSTNTVGDGSGLHVKISINVQNLTVFTLLCCVLLFECVTCLV